MRLTPRKLSAMRIDLLLVLPFLLFFIVQLVHHEMWRDELNAWGIVVASPNPKVLYQHIRYEGHPSLWYIALWIPSRFTSSPLAMKCVEGVIGVAIYLMIALRGPFSRLEKVLLYISYFISFEYTVMSRMYGLSLLLVLIYAYRRSRYPRAFVSNVALLALVANADVTTMILSSALLVEYALASYPEWRRGEIASKVVVRSALVYAAGCACALLALRISPHISWRTTGRMFVYARSLRHLVAAAMGHLAGPWIPISAGYPKHFWYPSYFPPGEHKDLLVLSLAIALIYAWIFRREWKLGVMVALTIAGGTLFAHLIYFGTTRHFGVVFVAFLAALWMQRYRRPKFSILVVALLALGAVNGVRAAIAQWDHPFSQGSNAVAWLRQMGLDKAVLVGTPDTSVAGIAEQMQRPIYFLDCNCEDTFLLFSNRRDDFDPVTVPQRLLLASQKLKAQSMIFITTYPQPAERVKAIRDLGLNFQLLASFTGAEEGEENYYIQRVWAP